MHLNYNITLTGEFYLTLTKILNAHVHAQCFNTYYTPCITTGFWTMNHAVILTTEIKPSSWSTLILLFFLLNQVGKSQWSDVQSRFTEAHPCLYLQKTWLQQPSSVCLNGFTVHWRCCCQSSTKNQGNCSEIVTLANSYLQNIPFDFHPISGIKNRFFYFIFLNKMYHFFVAE